MTHVVVKGTFLEVEGDDDDDEQPSALRTSTAPAGMLMGKLNAGGRGADDSPETEYVDDGDGGWKRTGRRKKLETMEEAEEEQEEEGGGRRRQGGGRNAQGSPKEQGGGPRSSPKENRTPGSRRSPKVSGGGRSGTARRSPQGQGVMGPDPWGFNQAAAAAAAAQFGSMPAQTALPSGGATTAMPMATAMPPMGMPMMPGFFPPWPPAPNPFMAAAMNAAAMQMMAAGMQTAPTGGMDANAAAASGGMGACGGMGGPGMMGFPAGGFGGAVGGCGGCGGGGGAGGGAVAAQGSPKRRNGKRGGQQQQQQQVGVSNVEAGDSQGRTTVMLRNIPNNYTRAMLLELLDEQGLAGRYDFVYLPFDFKTTAGLGFAFVNLLTSEDADMCRARLTGFRQWAIPSGKVCEVGWSGGDQQGLDANVERYRNSSVMHGSVDEDLKPIIFRNGTPAPFPKPTRKVWPPHSNYGLRARRGQAH